MNFPHLVSDYHVFKYWTWFLWLHQDRINCFTQVCPLPRASQLLCEFFLGGVREQMSPLPQLGH